MHATLPFRRVTLIALLLGSLAPTSCGTLTDRLALARLQREEALLARPSVADSEQALQAVTKIVTTSALGKIDTGSGLILPGKWERAAYIVTAFHVISAAGSEGRVQVFFKDLPGRPQPAQFVVADEALDLAVIRVTSLPIEEMEEFVPFKIGRSSDVGVWHQGKLGITVYSEITDELAQRFRLSETEGALVSAVAPESGAASDNLREGDLIIALNGSPIRSTADLVAQAKGLVSGTYLALDVVRNGEQRQLSGLVGPERYDDTSPIYSIGHPPEDEWSWRSGFLLSNSDPDFLTLTPSVVEFGISGGPILDNQYRVIGIATRQGDRYDTALRIERVEQKLAEWKIPYKVWLSADFCSKLLHVLDERGTNFFSLRKGIGSPGIVRDYEAHIWDATIDLSGRNNSKVVLKDDGDYQFRTLMSGYVGSRESELVSREVVSKIRECLPDSSLKITTSGFKITYKKDFWDTPRSIYVSDFGYGVVLQIPGG